MKTQRRFQQRGLAAFFVCIAIFAFADSAVAQRSSGIKNAYLDTYGLSAKRLVGELDLSPLVVDSADEPVVIKSGPLLLDEARETLRKGNLSLAMELFYAHMITEFGQAEGALKAVRFSPHLRQPVWQVRWGVSLAVRGGDAREANPIGGPSGRSGAGARNRGDQVEEENESELLESALGLVATKVGEAFRQRVMEASFGGAMGILNQEAEEPAEASPARRSRPGADPAEADTAAGPTSILETAPPFRPMWYPGIVFLGEGASTETIEIAKELGLDFMLHFDVVLKTDRDDKIENTSRCRVIQVSDGKALAASKGMDQNEAERFTRAKRGTTEEYITEQLDLVLTLLDQKAKVIAMPALTKEIAKKRVGLLLSASPLKGATRPSLQALAEIRMYESLGLLDATEVDTAFDFVGGADALFLMYGPLDAKLDQARHWAVDALPADSGN